LIRPIIFKEFKLFKVEQKKILEKKISKQIHDFSWKCRRTGPECLAREFLSEKRVREQIRMLQSLVPSPLRGTKILEIGCGYGMFLLGLRLWEGALAYGVEPGSDQYMNLKIASDIMNMGGLSGNSLICSNGESLPFPANSFEVIYSSNVLEHVDNPLGVLKEAFRILRPGGRMVFIVPNYLSVWEGHYRLPWLPLFNWRPIGRAYLRALGRDPEFFDSLKLVTPKKISQWLKHLDGEYEVVGMGEDIWTKRMNGEDFGTWGGLEILKTFVTLFKKLYMTNLVVKATTFLDMYTPIILTVKKLELH
jgi:SAM-dependent methyltransferase